MIFDWSAPVAAGIQAAAGIYGQRQANVSNARQAKRMMDFQREENARAMSFSERMASTSWQRGVADMKAAGINPMLAVSQGPASSPSGVTSAGAASRYENEYSHIPDSISSAVQVAMLKANLAEIASRVRLNESASAKNLAESRNVRALTPGLEKQAEFDSTMYGTATRWGKNIIPLAESSAHTAKSVYAGFAKVNDLLKRRAQYGRYLDHFSLSRHK